MDSVVLLHTPMSEKMDNPYSFFFDCEIVGFGNDIFLSFLLLLLREPKHNIF
jgi:hypothetical protein